MKASVLIGNALIALRAVASWSPAGHTVLVEGVSLTTCPHCAEAAAQMHAIYASGTCDVCYVAYVADRNAGSSVRLNELDVQFVPHYVFDGGVETWIGSADLPEAYTSRITACCDRAVPDLAVTVRAVGEAEAFIGLAVNVANRESAPYLGRLRVCVAERESRWKTTAGDPFHCAMIGPFVIDQGIAVPAGETSELQASWDGMLAGFVFRAPVSCITGRTSLVRFEERWRHHPSASWPTGVPRTASTAPGSRSISGRTARPSPARPGSRSRHLQRVRTDPKRRGRVDVHDPQAAKPDEKRLPAHRLRLPREDQPRRRREDPRWGVLGPDEEAGLLDDLFAGERKFADVRANRLLPRSCIYSLSAREPSWGRGVLDGIKGLLSAARYAIPRLSCDPGIVPYAIANLLFNREVSLYTPRTFYVKVSTGCLSACTYCGVRFARGRLRSKPLDRVVAEFREGIAAGFTDFLLIGTDLGCYGRDRGTDLAGLLKSLLALEGDFTVKVRIVHPRFLIDMLPELRAVLRSGRISFLGVPIQSGNDRILGLMRRG